MFCSNCGNEVAEGAKFCSVCGARLSLDAEPSVHEHTAFSSSDREANMKIGNKEVKEIIIKDSTGELIADITDDDIISKTNVIVELINTKEDKELSLQEIQVRAANKLFEAIDNMNINEITIDSAETIVNSLVKVMNVRLG